MLLAKYIVGEGGNAPALKSPRMACGVFDTPGTLPLLPVNFLLLWFTSALQSQRVHLASKHLPGQSHPFTFGLNMICDPGASISPTLTTF